MSEHKDCCSWTCAWVTFTSVVALFFVIRRLIQLATRPAWRSVRSFVGSKGWSVITGATDGIGKGFAEELARAGSNIVLVSRSESKLNDVAQEIRSKYSVETRVIAIDFASATDADYARLKDGLAGLEIGVLVNNVGVNSQIPNKLHEMDLKDVTNMININVTATTRVSMITLPFMVARRNGLVINLSSISGKHAAPLMAVYSGTKAYADTFSTALQAEYHRDGIEVVSITPSFVATSMSNIRRTSLFVCDARRLARDTLNKFNTGGSISPFWPHCLQQFAIGLIPFPLRGRFMLNTMEKSRRGVLRKLERQKSQ